MMYFSTRNVSIEARLFYSTVAVAQDYRLPVPLLHELKLVKKNVRKESRRTIRLAS